MEIIVNKVTKESRQAQGKTYWGVEHGGNWYNFVTNDKPKVGFRYNVEVNESQWNGKTYRWAKPAASPKSEQRAKPNGNGNGQIKWDDYAEMMRAAHSLANELEPDRETDVGMSKAAARAALVNTAMIAFSNGKIALEEGPPPPEDDGGIPF
jgi:hypothetical protein